jgi:uncharacterized repeat protein (TIGR01451 family)
MSKSTFYHFCNAIIAFVLSTFLISQATAQCTSGTLSGTVYSDVNYDGTFDGSDSGVSGIRVRVYDTDGQTVGQALSSNDGQYTITGLTDGDPYIVTFILGSDDAVSNAGPDNGTDVQKVVAPYCETNLGLASADNSCNESTELILSCFVNGVESTNENQETLIGIQHNFNGSSPVTVYATQAETGSVWGMAYDSDNDDIYSSAFIKQNTALGIGGHDAIYKTSLSGTPNTSLLTTLTALGQNAGTLSVTNSTDCDYGVQVGRIGLGAMDLDADSDHLYVVNLHNRTLVSVNINNPIPSETRSYSIPDPGCSNGDYRPFAVNYYNDAVYVGVTCTAETSRNDVETSFHIYKLNPNSGNFSLEFSSDYRGGHWNDTPNWKQQSFWLTDIEFTNEGNMVLGISDRIGHRYCTTTNSRLDEQHGEILMVANVNGQWILENNGIAGDLTGSGVGNNDGPGGGEFFGEDFFPADPEDHHNIAIGSIAIVPGTDDVVSSVFDPLFDNYSGGLHRYSTTDGSKISSQQLYNRNLISYFGKATGFGDIVTRCGSLSSQVGNYVWSDTNCDGIQNANESGISGLAIDLFDADCNVIATTTTDDSGYYAFDNINSGSSYTVAVSESLYDNVRGSYLLGEEFYTPTVSNDNAQLNSNLKNSSVCLDYPSTSFIAQSGNNTSIDLGLKTSTDFDLALMKLTSDAANIKVGEVVEFTIEVYNQGGLTADNYEIVDYLTPAFEFKQALNPGWRVDGNKVKFLEDNNLLPGEKRYHNINLIVSQSTNSEDYINVAEISISNDINGSNTDIDSQADDIATNDTGGQINTDTDNQIDNDGTVDEDDQDPAEVCILDLALMNVARSQASYRVGDMVTFDITVYNQGNIATTSFEIVSQYPSTLDFAGADNPGWSSLSSDIVTMKHDGILEPGDSKTYSVNYRLNSSYEQDEVIVLAEISSLVSSKPGVTEDFDSTPDAIFGNDNGGQINSDTDNQIDNDGSIDEDDEDPASISSYKLDLALIITTDHEYVQKGDFVDFEIEIHNQGETSVSSVMIMDFVPVGFSLVGSDWLLELNDPTNQMYYRTINFANGFNPGDVHISSLTLEVLDDATAGYNVNYAEIGVITDMFGNDVSLLDIDSQADKDMFNDAGGQFLSANDNRLDGNGIDDEDDEDPAGVYLATIEIRDPCTCKSNATDAFDGQFDEQVIVTAPSGQNWYLDFVFDIFDPTSAAPPAAPTPYTLGAMGYQLIEVPLNVSTSTGVGISEYILDGIIVDAIPYSVRVTNGEGAFLQISGGGDSCVYSDPIIESDGLSAVCGGSSFTYCIDPIADCTSYAWTLSGGGVISGSTSGTCVTVNWGAATGGPFDLVVTPTCMGTCVAPGVASINIGTSTGPMSCLSEINISLDDNCRTQLQAQDFLTIPIADGVEYQMMVTDHNGNPVPNAILTDEHLWTSLMVKVINPCDGNSCWSTINVEDKLGPEIQCEDITMPCYELDNYRPLVADNCSAATFELIAETTTPLFCNEDFIKEVTRTYRAEDAYGNTSSCDQTILLERIEIDSIVFPENLTVTNMNNLICNDSIFDADGRPRLDLTGVPTLFGRPLIPQGDYYCNFYIDFSDFTIVNTGCTTKIMRTFVAYEDWCSNNNFTEFVQTIEILDTLSPTVICPENLVISTNGTPGCDQEVSIPLPEATDNCGTAFTYDLSFPGGFLQNITTAQTVTLSNGTNEITFNVYDECENRTTCTMNVTVEDNVSPVAICDRFTSVSLRSDGTAKAFAHTFDDGSFDDCKLFKFLARRMNSNCDCGRPVFDDMTYLGERNGRLYYLSNYRTNAFEAFNYSTAFGGMILREESCEEKDFIFEKVNEVNPGATYYTGIIDSGHEGDFTFTNHAPIGCDAFPTTPVGANGDNVIVDVNGNYMVVNGSTVETYFVVELTDPCGFSDEVKFCCEDLGEQMVVFRAIDKGGRFNDCMVNVTVQDKVAPTITCPPNLEISCDSPINFDDLSEFGVATASDSCSFTLTEEFVEGINSCGQGMIMRTFTASDNGGSSFCTQDITLVNETPFDLSSITLPQDFFTDMGCNSGDLLPENLPEGFGLPEFELDACAMIGVTFSDQTFTFAGPDSDACLKILRTYTIIDWCQSDDPDYEPIVHEQTIKVTNTVGPVLSGCEDIEIRTDECDFEDVSFTVSAVDDCTESDRLRVTFELQLSDGTVLTDASSSGSYTFSGKLPIGRHIALTSFADLCGNLTTCSKIIDVINVKAPTAACKDGLSIGLVPMDLDNDGFPDNEMACIFPEMIDASSTHVCGLPIKLSFSSDTTDVKKVFDCTDLGPNEVQLWVTLCNPGSDTLIQSFCTITVEVQDNNNVDFCPRFDLALTKTISASNTPPYEPGDDVTFDVTVINQGNVSAFNIGLVDYIPNGLTLNDSDWTDNGNGNATLNTPIPFLEDSTSTVVPITFSIDQNNPGTTITNFAEISTADNDNDPTNGTADDDDSIPDTDPDDDGVVTDDAVNNENGDEDDHDPADLKISVFDLALTKVINIASTPGPYNPGDDVSFIISLFNQGNVDATNIVITDYIPAGFTFNAALSPSFTLIGNNVQATVPSLAGGATMSVGVTLTIDADYTGDCLINSAEITSADNADNLTDQDSDLTFISNGNSPELGSDNDIADDSTGGTDNPNDQDDYDPAKVDVICNLAPICSSVSTLSVTLDNNGTASIDVSQIDNGSAPQCDGSTITTMIDVNSFSCTDVGSGNIVTLTITDSNGQISSCQTNVTVVDDEDPMIQCQNVLTTLDDNGDIVLDGVVIVTSATDNCGVVDTMINTTSIDLNTIDCIPQNATATVTDAFGNSATCIFQIAIMNNPPVAQCFDNFTLTLSPTGQSTLIPGNINNNSTDDCTTDLTFSLNQTDFDCTNVGMTTVILTVTDASGLSSTCTSVVTVIDDTPPTALCSDISINVDSNGNATIGTADIDNGSSDLCSAVTLELDQTMFDCDDKGANTVILTVTDASDNSATCSATVTVDDIISPTVTCVADFTIQLDGTGMTTLDETHFIAADADNCAVVSRSSTPGIFTCDDKGAPVVVTVTVSDACNNSAQCTVNVTVEDNVAPTCTLLDDLVFAPNVEITVADVFNTFNDNCAMTSSATTIAPSMFTCMQLGPQMVTVTVNDDCGNSGQCTTEVTIEDQDDPICMANDLTVCLDAMGSYTLSAADMMAITNGTTAGCDMMFTTTFSQTDFDCSNTATPVNLVVTLTTSDNDVSTCNALITVVDKDAPTITCVANTTIDLNDNGQVNLVPADIIATSNDNCPFSTSINTSLLDCDDKDTPITITATATDQSGNSSTCTTVVTVEDNTAPTCELFADLTFAPNVTISVADVFDTFNDNCADVSSASTIAPSTFTCMQLGTQMVTVTVNDDCGNSGTCTTSVEIVDMDEPVCVANDITVCLDATGQYTLNQTDIDNITNGSAAGCDDMFTLELDIVEFLCNDTNNPVLVTVTLTSGGTTTTCTADVTVEDKIDPTVTCVNDFTLDLNANGIATLTPSMIIATSDDNCSFIQEIDVTQLTCDNKDNATTVTATVTDQVGNTVTCTTDVSVEDNMDPVCTLTAGLIFPPNVTIEVADVLATFTDNCSDVSSSSTIAPSMFTCMELGMNTVTVTVNDDCGNSSTCSVDVDIQDNSVPTAVCQDITVSLDGGGMVMIEGADVDGGSSSACGTSFTFSVNPDAFDCGDIGDNNVVLTVSSTGGSSSTCTAVVTVEDVTPPTVVCPADVVLPCNSDVSNPSMFGEPNVSDNCDPNIFVEENTVSDINACSVGTVTRVFTATDNFNNSASCTQVITVSPPVNPISDADIIAPPTPVTFNECFDPSNIVTQGPIVDTSNADCFDLSVSFTDNPNPAGLMCNGTFTRTWVVTDQCQSPTFVRTYSQQIILNDNIGPMIDGPDDVLVIVDPSATTCDTFLTLPATVTDCIGGFTVSNNSMFADDNNSADASGTYSGGTTDVTITATDACGSVSTYSYSVTVLDTSAFIKDCDKIIVAMQSSQMVNVNVSQSNADICSICPVNDAFTLSWSDTSPDVEIMTLDCSFVGITNYVVYLWSGTTLVDSCGNLLQVLDGGGFCSTPNIGEVAGKVITENNIDVEGVMVNLLGSELSGIETGVDGVYAFNDMPFGGQYDILPSKDRDYLNGVSTADIISIQRHILGSQLLDSPYKLIAADVNNSEDISTLDLIEIRKLILGIKDEFTNNTSWRMIDAEHQFIDELNPFLTTVPEDYYIQNFNQSMLVDFIGVKIGDVNNSVIANVNESVVEKRDLNAFDFEISEKEYRKGTTQQITFRTEDLASIDGVQMSVLFDTDKVDLIGFVPHVSDLSIDHINVAMMDEGILNMSWNKQVTQNSKELFSVIVNVKQGSWTSEMFNVATQAQDYIRPEAYSIDGKIKSINLNYTNDNVQADELIVYQNLPNPWTESTMIKYYISNNDQVTLTVYDVNGKTLLNRSMEATPGLNSFELRNTELNTSGVMYYELTTSNKKDIQKMLLIK